MDNYTEKLSAGAEDFYEYEAEKKLPEIIASFRGHGDALSRFMDDHGYDAEDTPAAKAAFLKRKFHEAGIGSAKSRNTLKWLTELNSFERETGFRIAFALNLTVEETDDFFRTVLLDRSFDCHTIKEAIYFYCIYNRKSYPTAGKLISAAPNPEKGPVPQGESVLYTKNIVSFLRSCPDEETLLRYFNENLAQFGYNQVKAKEYIQLLWNQISAPNGLAALERRFFWDGEEKIFTDDADSFWNIYLQMLGLDTDDAKYIEKDRTIKPILENKTFMHQFAARNFPNRQSTLKMLQGISTEHDLIRKTLILFAFYQFWINIAVSGQKKTYMAGPNDRERCLSELDQYLMDAGFPELYAGNPFDWIFIWAAGRESPMQAFRSYWQFLSAEFSESRS